jgi:hypothetical protein
VAGIVLTGPTARRCPHGVSGRIPAAADSAVALAAASREQITSAANAAGAHSKIRACGFVANTAAAAVYSQPHNRCTGWRRHVIGWSLTRQTRVYTVDNDAVGIMYLAPTVLPVPGGPSMQ